MHFHQSHSHSHPDSLPVFTSLSQIYADIEGELCSKQSTQLNKLKNSFSSIYSGLLPSHYLILNHVLSLSDFAYSKALGANEIKMATENGIIFLLKQTYLGEKIFINGLLEDQLIFQSKGCLSQEEKHSLSSQDNQMVEELQKTIQLANDELALNKLFGATILVYSSISQNTKHYKEKLLLGIFLSTLIINETLNHYTLEQIYQKLYQSHLFTIDFLQTQFMPFNQGELIITKHLQNQQSLVSELILQSFKIPNKQKLLFFDLNFTQQQLQTINNNHLQTQHSFTKTQMSQIQQFSYLTSDKMEELQNGTITLSNFINSLHHQMKLNPKINTLFSPLQKSIQSLIDEVANLLDGNHLIFCVKPHEIHEKIRILRKFINSQFSQNPQIIANRFNRAKGVDKILFSSSPSLAIAILNPEHQIWFK